MSEVNKKSLHDTLVPRIREAINTSSDVTAASVRIDCREEFMAGLPDGITPEMVGVLEAYTRGFVENVMFISGEVIAGTVNTTAPCEGLQVEAVINDQLTSSIAAKWNDTDGYDVFLCVYLEGLDVIEAIGEVIGRQMNNEGTH